MVGLMRGSGTALTCLLLLATVKVADGSPAPASPGVPSSDPAAQDKPAGTTAPAPAQAPGQAQAKPDVAVLFSQPGDEPPRPFVPLHARTVDDRQRSEAVRLYAAARALEDQKAFSDAVALLQQVQKLDPESVAIARRLSRIYLAPWASPSWLSSTAGRY